MIRKQNGFTLLETSIVLVGVGLLVGGTFVAQELVANARVHALIAQQDSIKVAYFGFHDRFGALPGDYSKASVNIACTPACTNGDGNHVITGISDNPAAPINEYIAVWEHLSHSGFLSGSYTYAAVNSPATTPIYMFGQYPTLKFDALYGGSAASRHNLKTGDQIPSHILAEVDRKIDDGYATTGSYRFSSFVPATGGTVLANTDSEKWSGTASGVPVGPGSCYAATPPNGWADRSVSNCGAATLF